MLQLPIDPEAVEAQQRAEREAAARQQREAHHADHAALRDLREHFRLVMDRAFRQQSAGQLWRPQLLGADVQVRCCFDLRVAGLAVLRAAATQLLVCHPALADSVAGV